MCKNKVYFTVEANESTLNEKIMEEFKKRELNPQTTTYNVEGVGPSFKLKTYFICATERE